MASLISCPHCGSRPKEEFTVRGSADISRPAPEAGMEEWMDYVYLRANQIGVFKEYWHHSAGCRRWLIVERNNMTHDVTSVMDAALKEDAE
jgi:sarcosine oxidase subunit delta